MTHDKKIQDNEPHFIIDPLTRTITNSSSGNNIIVQYDHNSERFTFEIPRYVDGHDMSESDEVRVHYVNSASTKLNNSSGVYICDDLAISDEDENKVTFSWLLSSAATQYIGFLHFSIQFVCLDGETIEYAWNTGVYKDIVIIESINNANVIVETYPDILEQWKSECVDPLEQRVSTLEDYMKMVIKPTLTYYCNSDSVWNDDGEDYVSTIEGWGNYNYGISCTVNRTVTDVAGLETTDGVPIESLDHYHDRYKLTDLQMGYYVTLYLHCYGTGDYFNTKATGCSYTELESIEVENSDDYECYRVLKITNIGNDAVIKFEYSE